MADSDTPQASFLFADHLVLDQSPTREFYRSLLQGLIHKNNNVLGVISGFSSLILMDNAISGSVRSNVEQMKDSAQNATDLARIILTSAGCARVSADRVSLKDFMVNAERNARALAEEAGVPIRVNVSPSLPPVTADVSKLGEVLTELTKNAVEAAASLPDGGGEVAIDVLPPGEASPIEDGRVDYFIRNSSENVSPEKLREWFVPFHTGKGGAHFGLGLTTAGVLAGQMGMRLGIRNTENTTTAWLSLPVAA
ncbi:MAG: HAMP domain-containing histidine kinase [Verrucomicrobiae bacterium]|nr:HAMP domain-containing histidine kinase [Verrucomicrobiae bacterium]MCP5538720.1 HAMP domain-containing histidine kinase [Akkermansiaceae bacterium]